MPRSPSSDSSSAVSSPQMYAPAPAVHDDVAVEARSRGCRLPRKPFAPRVGDGAREAFVAERELAPHVHVRDVALHRVRRDRDALDELVRIALEEHAVLERRRLAFVGVHDEIARERVGRQERPLLRGREARAAAAPQARQLHLLLDVGRVALGSTARSDSYAPDASAPSIVHESSGRSRRRLVTMRVSLHSGNSARQPTCAPEIVRRAARARPVALDDLLGRARRDVLVELVVHLQRRRAAARRETLDFLHGDLGLRPVTLLEVIEHLGTAGDETRDVGADRHDELSARSPLQHRVEGTRAEHVGRGGRGQLRDLLHRLGREPAVLVLREVREREDRRLRSAGNAPGSPRLRHVRLVEEAHRSTSPRIGSMLDTIATASATRLSEPIGPIDCRL